MVRIPSSREKHYLTGVDWMVHGLDYVNRRVTGAGNMFQIVMELEAAPAEDELRQCLDRFLEKFPVVNGRAGRDYNLAPYWKMPPREARAPFRLNVHRPKSQEDVASILESAANAPFVSRREHVVFHLIDCGSKSCVAVTFDHCLFDAHGAEAFLSMFQEEWEKRGAAGWRTGPPEPAHLSDWRRKFEAGKRVNRTLLRLAEGAPPRVLRTAGGSEKRGFKFGVISFSEEQTRQIVERADSEAGYFMLMPYTMALTAQILHGIFARRGVDGGDYIVPVTVDTRVPGEETQEVFFNHVSFLVFRLCAREVEDLPVLLESIKRQLYEQVKVGLARDICEATLPMRIVPLRILNSLMRLYFKGEVASFFFSFLGETGARLTRFMGEKIRESYHMTRVPISPGLGVFFQRSQGRLKAYLSHAEGLLGEEEVKTIVEGLRSRLED